MEGGRDEGAGARWKGFIIYDILVFHPLLPPEQTATRVAREARKETTL